MNDTTQNPALNEEADELPIDELVLLKQRATMMGITFSNNIKLETLKERIQAKLEGTEAEGDKPEVAATKDSDPVKFDGAPVSLRQHLINEKMKLVRCRITNLDPKKKDLFGEIFTISNEYIGTVRKFVPYGEATDDGYHLPQCLFDLLNDRKFLNIRTRKDPRTGNVSVEQVWAKEFSLDVLPQLTEHELNQLVIAQKTQ